MISLVVEGINDKSLLSICRIIQKYRTVYLYRDLGMLNLNQTFVDLNFVQKNLFLRFAFKH